MKKTFPVIGLAIISFSTVCAQQIQINESQAITQLMAAWTETNRAAPSVAGWRVQLMSVTDRKQAEDGKLRFRTQFPEIHVDWAHEKPYYKLRAGAFRTKQEALALILELKDFYPGAYPAQDNHIHPREFIE